MIFEWVIFAVIIAIVIGFIIWILISTAGTGSKKPYIFDGNSGAKGVFITWDNGPQTKPDHSDLHFHPHGNIFKKAVISNVPNAIRNIGVKHSPMASHDGVDRAGYVFLPKGTDGNGKFLDMYNIELGNSAISLQRQLRTAQIRQRIADDDAEEERSGLLAKAKQESEISGELSKMKKRRSPFGGGEYD